MVLDSCGTYEETTHNIESTTNNIEETTTDIVEETTEKTTEYVVGEIDLFDDYGRWSYDIYDSGAVYSQGVSGINEDYYHTLPEMEEYNSGKIVIGDSRCFQMGIFEQENNIDDYAVFAVWGGHYVLGRGFNILSESNLEDVRQCFESQIESKGECTIFLFSSVNDYNYSENNNEGNIEAVVSAALTLSEFRYEKDGKTYLPNIKIIGFDGCVDNGELYGTPSETFNMYIEDFSNKLQEQLREAGFSNYTTVMDIVGGKAGFVSDGLHYDELTIYRLGKYISER